ncbi:hypothetical protein BgiMline_005925 [Biomphalaria glabrata]|uniref:Voltage-dependent calcium channel gamma-7 subunit n=1 Tax=Biomphalaria pfeifferi TaxID=112525 RepID=A0AAD8AZR3_BIOPF|nr:voltage-dependent calcium channel gamma-7 subunit [Biomphalaria glabrata]KAK0045431.1 voltage-dependent calcium channel gamma-7 subunit [Biomphalaria pfeifferi]
MPPFVIRVALLFSIHALPFAVSPPKVGHIFQGRRHLQPAWGTGGEITMDCCTKRRLLTVMTSVCACAAFGLLSISVATDYWLFTKEKAKETPGNKTVGAKYKCVYSGLWRRCKYGESFS